jgi:Type III flagellar switch regulator (C-ring) FliN C-term
MVNSSSDSAWLSPIESQGRVRTLQAYSQINRIAMVNATSLLITRWQLAWGWLGSDDDAATVGNAEHRLQVLDVSEYTASNRWKVRWNALQYPNSPSGGTASLNWQVLSEPLSTAGASRQSLSRAIQSALFLEKQALSSTPTAIGRLSLAQEVAESAERDLWERWLKICVHQPTDQKLSGSQNETSTVAELVEPGPFDGFLFVQFYIGRLCVAVSLTPQQVQAIVRFSDSDSNAPLFDESAASTSFEGSVRVEEALKSHPVGLHVFLQPASISLAQLQALRLNDVLLLDQSLDSPIQVQSDQREVVARAWLGKRQDMVAIELTPTLI